MAMDLTKTFLAWMMILPAAYQSGTLFRPFLRMDDRILKGIFFVALGFGVLSTSVVALSLCRCLKPLWIWVLLAGFVLFRVGQLREFFDWLRFVVSEFTLSGSFLKKSLILLFLASFTGLLLGTLTPEIGGDALAYQLNLPKQFLRHGSLAPDPYDYNAYFPLFMNNLYLIGLATGGVMAAKLFHFFCGFFLFLAVYRAAVLETGQEALSLFVGLVLWVTPTVFNLLSTTYIDVAVAFYSFLSLWMFIAVLDEARPAGFFVSGLLTGAAVSIKYLSLMSAAGIFAVWLYDFIFRKKRSQSVLFFGVWGLGVLLVAGGWLIRNALATGNPFFPYFGSFFSMDHRPPTNFHIYGLGKDVIHFLRLFWDMFYSSARFGSSTTRIGIFYLLSLPFSILAMVKEPRARRWGVYALCFLVVWFFGAQADRWIIPVLPVLCLMAAYGLRRCAVRTFPAVPGLVGMALLAVYTAAGLYHYRFAYRLFTGAWSQQEYLQNLERTQPVAAKVNEALPQGAKLLVESEPRKYYFNRDLIYDVFLEWKTRYSSEKKSPQALYDFYKSLGITHLVTDDPIDRPRSDDSAVRRVAASEFVKEVFNVRSQNIRDAQLFYRVYELR